MQCNLSSLFEEALLSDSIQKKKEAEIFRQLETSDTQFHAWSISRAGVKLIKAKEVKRLKSKDSL